MKKFVILSITLLFALSAQAFEFAVDNFKYYTTGSDSSSVCLSGYVVEPVGELTISSSVTYIGKNYPITSLGEFAFVDCTKLTSVTISEGVTSIGSYAFVDCTNLSSIILPESLISIAGGAFGSCTSLVSITLPDGLTSIGEGSFSTCASLTSIEIPEGVTSIRVGTFEDCVSLTSIILPKNLTTIAEGAFLSCRSLSSIILPDSLTSIAANAFCGCVSLSSITIPEGVTSIGKYAFQRCTSLTSIILPKSLTSIGDGGTFSACIALSQIVVADGNTAYATEDGVLFSKDKTRIIAFPFAKAKQYSIPSGVIYIDDNAFLFCSNLISISLPESLTSIGDGAFVGCNDLQKLYVRNSLPPTILALYVFDGVNTSTCKLYVPIGSKEAYKAAYMWKYFHNIEEIDMTSISESEEAPFMITSDGDGITITGVEPGVSITVYTVTGIKLLSLYANSTDQRITLPKSALYFVKAGNQVKKIIL